MSNELEVPPEASSSPSPLSPWISAGTPPPQDIPFTGHWEGQGFESQTVLLLWGNYLKVYGLGKYIKPTTWSRGSWVDSVGKPYVGVTFWAYLPTRPHGPQTEDESHSYPEGPLQ